MNADRELTAAYENWRGLAETEGQAIREGNWNLVSACQSALSELQGKIIQLTDAARREWARAGVDLAAREKSVRSVISQLIELERRNSTLLNAFREAAQIQFGQLEETSRNLKRLQKSYAPPRAAAWTSFS